MAYEDPSVYDKYLSSSSDDDDCGCQECSECCPPGLVSVKDANGGHVGCLTPADAQEFYNNNRQCPQGTLQLYKEGEIPLFRGCVSEAEFETLYAILNP